MATRTIILTTTGGGTWTVPYDVDTTVGATVECIGGGEAGKNAFGTNNQRGGGGGNGGDYATGSIALARGATVYVNIGAGGLSNGAAGGDTWFNTLANSAPTAGQTATGVSAGGGGGGTSRATTVHAGGAAGNSTSNSHTGGDGGTGAGGGGGGAGGIGAAGGATAGGNGGLTSTETIRKSDELRLAIHRYERAARAE